VANSHLRDVYPFVRKQVLAGRLIY
jgi:hypothetical protein